MEKNELHPLVKRVLDGELRLEELPADVRAEGEPLVRLLDELHQHDVRLSENVDRRVMAEVRARAAARKAPRGLRVWRWWMAPHDLRVTIRPWMVGASIAAAALVLMVVRPGSGGAPAVAARGADSVFVRFELYAPGARSVNLAGSFNQWNAGATPLVQVNGSGLWTVTLPLPAGASQYGFIVDGQRWVPDPAAPSVDDGFGRRNSVVAVPGEGRSS